MNVMFKLNQAADAIDSAYASGKLTCDVIGCRKLTRYNGVAIGYKATKTAEVSHPCPRVQGVAVANIEQAQMQL
jgi:hypothetical protein